MHELIERTEALIEQKKQAAFDYVEKKQLTGEAKKRYLSFINDKEIAPLVELIESIKSLDVQELAETVSDAVVNTSQRKTEMGLREYAYFKGKEAARAESKFRMEQKWGDLGLYKNVEK